MKEIEQHYVIVDNRTDKALSVQQHLPKYLGVKTNKYSRLLMFYSRSEADDAAEKCNKVAGGKFFSVLCVTIHCR